MEIYPIGGYGEPGRNCTAIKVGEEIILLDMGIELGNYIRFQEEGGSENTSDLIEAGAIPDVNSIKDISGEVKAIIPSHAHYDHIGSIPKVSNDFDASIIGTPFTMEVLKRTVDEGESLNNKQVKVNVNDSYKISDSVTVEFVNVTHSIPQTCIIILHTSEGKIAYANDFKLDDTPVIGSKPDYDRLSSLKGEIDVLIVDSLYAKEKIKMPSESIAKEMVKENLIEADEDGKALIVTTFSSHISRLKSIIEFSNELDREVVVVGRSMNKYISAAESIDLVDFTDDVGRIHYGRNTDEALRKVSEDKGRYLVIMTGHQGEPNAVLSRVARGEYPLSISRGDSVVFSCDTIPTDLTKANRGALEDKIERKGARIFSDVHVSGHAGREDIRKLISLLEPSNIVPTHGESEMLYSVGKLAKHMGYDADSIHLVLNGQKLDMTPK